LKQTNKTAMVSLIVVSLLLSYHSETSNSVDVPKQENNNIKIEEVILPLTATLPSKEINRADVKTITMPTNQQSFSRGGMPPTIQVVDFTVTHYTDLPEENGGHVGTCEGKKLVDGMVASNFYPLGTKIYLEGIGIVTVSDRGGNDFNKNNRLDRFVPRLSNESTYNYKKRTLKMGRQAISGYIIK
jgi:3D (Asp-Asp-Asp) domain-containing protein